MDSSWSCSVLGRRNHTVAHFGISDLNTAQWKFTLFVNVYTMREYCIPLIIFLLCRKIYFKITLFIKIINIFVNNLKHLNFYFICWGIHALGDVNGNAWLMFILIHSKKSRSTLVIKWSCFKLLHFSERLSEHELKILLILVIFK